MNNIPWWGWLIIIWFALPAIFGLGSFISTQSLQ